MSDFNFLTPNNDIENHFPSNNSSKRKSIRFSPYLRAAKAPLSNNPFVNGSIMGAKDVCHEHVLTERQHTPVNAEFFSPDFHGRLFPKEINSNQIHMKNVDNLLKRLRKQYSCSSESSSSFPSDSFLPSPDTHDSCIGSSITTSRSNLHESCYPESLLVINNSPSSFKWNRKEYQSDHDDTSYEMPNLNESSNNGDSMSQNRFESTQIFENGQTLADNFSMRRLSVIRSINNQLAKPDVNLSDSLDQQDQSFKEENIDVDEKVSKLYQRFFDQSPRHVSSSHWKTEFPMPFLTMSPRRVSMMDTSPVVAGSMPMKPLPDINLSPILFKPDNKSCNK